jgi:starvation-inducible DNA-binding protein
MKADIGLTDKNRLAIVALLNQHVADIYVLYTKTRNYHWNVVGMHFNDLHEFFEGQYEQLNDSIDEIAERARALDGVAVATLTEFVNMSRLKEEPGKYPDAPTMLENLLADHESVIKNLRKDVELTAEEYRDDGTSDFLTGLMEQHEKMAWMIRSFLRKTAR